MDFFYIVYWLLTTTMSIFEHPDYPAALFNAYQQLYAKEKLVEQIPGVCKEIKEIEVVEDAAASIREVLDNCSNEQLVETMKNTLKVLNMFLKKPTPEKLEQCKRATTKLITEISV